MEQGQDKLVTCKCCKGNACYESEFTTLEGKIETWLCMTCGFTTNSTMKEGSELVEKALELTADLIKDERQVHNNLIWLPTVITMPDKGMIFPEPIKGTTTLDSLSKEKISKPDWKWTVVKAVPIPKKDQEKYPDPKNPGEFYKNRMDMKNLKRYDKLCFMDAAEALGMFENKPLPSNAS